VDGKVFIGHFAVAFASKKVAPRVSLGTLVIAAAFLDVVWPVLVLLGVERFRIVPGFTAINPFDFVYYPWSHSLLMTAVWFGPRPGGRRRPRPERAGPRGMRLLFGAPRFVVSRAVGSAALLSGCARDRAWL
jgi:hypothetical protein